MTVRHKNTRIAHAAAVAVNAQNGKHMKYRLPFHSNKVHHISNMQREKKRTACGNKSASWHHRRQHHHSECRTLCRRLKCVERARAKFKRETRKKKNGQEYLKLRVLRARSAIILNNFIAISQFDVVSRYFYFLIVCRCYSATVTPLSVAQKRIANLTSMTQRGTFMCRTKCEQYLSPPYGNLVDARAHIFHK